MARRAQHLRCSLREGSERADNKLDKISSEVKRKHISNHNKIEFLKNESKAASFFHGLTPRAGLTE